MKKRLIWLLAVALLILCIAGCGEEAPAEPEDVSTTLMVYMIGSDLESKSGAGTRDLQEMLESGVDLEKHTVLVYAGGSERWHTEAADQEQRTVLHLTESGFTAVAAMETASMGEASSLTEFLQYGWENYPSDRFALVLWDHGNGPLIGYGKDTLHKGDSLMLEEMQQALEASPFGAENKLSWVGFDACLMSSAELLCVWADYADYLVASQEIEPSFGWNYSFLSDLGKADVPKLLKQLTDGYLATCEAYYADRGYDNRDTTLACMDLSLVPQLEDAINGLFALAAEDVEQYYNLLTVRRVQTRALGRASTGSEYDLIDLNDMAVQMESVYPEAAKTLQAVLKKMVVSNATNAEGCCGLSLYYPFYNKHYFENSWNETYSRLGVFADYQRYLSAYQQTWLKNDNVEKIASSVMPQQESEGVYILPLTKDQQDSFASARYYILRRETQDLYNCVFVSTDVTNMDGLLVANFDGNVIYVKNDYQHYKIPVVEERGKTGDLTRYAVYVGLSNNLASTGQPPEGEEPLFEPYYYHLALDKDTGELSVSALLPHDEELDEMALVGGKLEDADLNQWREVLFWDQDHRYISYYENGAVKPFGQWVANSMFTGETFYYVDGMEFVYEPLDGGEYYLVMEVQDTQGSRYCSDMLPITVAGEEKPAYEVPQTQVSWQNGNRVLLKEENGVKLYLTTEEDFLDENRFTFELENNNDFPVKLAVRNLRCNDGMLCDGFALTLEARAGRTVYREQGVDFGMAEYAGATDVLENVEFEAEIRSLSTGELLLWQHFLVELDPANSDQYLGDRTDRFRVEEPFLGAAATEQVICNNERLRVTLLGLGNTLRGYADFRGMFRLDNLSEETLYVELKGMSVNHVYNPVYTGGLMTIPAGCSLFLEANLGSKFTEYGITQIESVDVLVRIVDNYVLGGGYSTLLWCPVELAQKGAGSEAFREEEQVIYEENGIRIALGACVEEYGSCSWRMTVYNGTEESIAPEVVSVWLNGEAMPTNQKTAAMTGGQVGPGQYGVGELNYYGPMSEVEELRFCIQIRDMMEESVIYTSQQIITIQP